jgi:hypothetical protein
MAARAILTVLETVCCVNTNLRFAWILKSYLVWARILAKPPSSTNIQTRKQRAHEFHVRHVFPSSPLHLLCLRAANLTTLLCSRFLVRTTENRYVLPRKAQRNVYERVFVGWTWKNNGTLNNIGVGLLTRTIHLANSIQILICINFIHPEAIPLGSRLNIRTSRYPVAEFNVTYLSRKISESTSIDDATK